jgi:hypothetical protein
MAGIRHRLSHIDVYHAVHAKMARTGGKIKNEKILAASSRSGTFFG